MKPTLKHSTGKRKLGCAGLNAASSACVICDFGLAHGNVVERVIRERAERLIELLVVEAGRAGRDDALGLEALAHHVAHQLDGVGGARDHQQQVGVERSHLGDLDRKILRLRIVGDRLEQFEMAGRRSGRSCPWPRAARCRRCRWRAGTLRSWPRAWSPRSRFLISLRPLVHKHAAGREVADQIFVALLGDLRRGADVDDQRHLALLADLRDRRASRRNRRRRRSACAPSLIARSVCVRATSALNLAVDMHQFDLVAVIGQDLGRDQRAAVAALAGRR